MRFPEFSLSITPEEFEKLVRYHIGIEGAHLESFTASHRVVAKGVDGEYEVDVAAEFMALGARFLVLIECKKQSRPVERDVVQILRDRLLSVGAQKGMIFTTSGFQKGALEYARIHGVALVVVRSGQALFRMNSGDEVKYDGPKFSLWRCLLDDAGRESWSSRETDASDPFSIVQ